MADQAEHMGNDTGLDEALGGAGFPGLEEAISG